MIDTTPTVYLLGTGQRTGRLRLVPSIHVNGGSILDSVLCRLNVM